jgi:aryl-alcohol dehydrogenase-like predicted oxidoreductase
MIAKQPFGRTGHDSTRLIFGSWALSETTQKEADQVLELLLEYGINHIDTAPMYGNAEKLIGKWMDTYRQDFFLATKTRKRGYKEAWEGLQKSLERLHTDHVDLWQMHGLTNPQSWEKAMGEGGALQAMLEARDKGLVRFLGVTGHGSKVPGMHLQSLERFDFDAVMLPYNYPQMQNQRYTADFRTLIDICHQRNTAIQTIKTIARYGVRARSSQYHTFFYEPLESQEAIEKAVHWAMGLRDCFVISVGDMLLLPKVLQAAACFKQPPSDDEMRILADVCEMKPTFS